MKPQTNAIKDRLLDGQPLDSEQQRALSESAELREFAAALDLLAFSDEDAREPEPNQVLDARILAFGRQSAAARQESAPLLQRIGIWHWVTGTLAACLIVVVTIKTVQTPADQQDGLVADAGDAAIQQPLDRMTITAPSPSDAQDHATPVQLPGEPALISSAADLQSWDAVTLEQEVFSLQSAIIIDLDRETAVDLYTDML